MAILQIPRYKCHKEVHAIKIKEVREGADCGWLVPEEAGFEPFLVSLEYMRKHEPVAGGYLVAYDDGYQSFSPADAFEAGYTKIEN